MEGGLARAGKIVLERNRRDVDSTNSWPLHLYVTIYFKENIFNILIFKPQVYARDPSASQLDFEQICPWYYAEFMLIYLMICICTYVHVST